MLVAFNLILLALVLLVAYWWATQGIFSGILHLLCVIVAGAIAFAFWEPLTAGLLLKGSKFDNFAWGVSMIGLFVIPLAILRLATNKLVPANVDLPHWANLLFGAPIGLCSGILSMGMLLIGIGFVQGHLSILDYKGYARDSNNAKKVDHVGAKLWFPVHEWTYNFYSWLSVTSFSTNKPLRQYYPDIHKVAWSQFRDSYRDGRGQVSMTPNAATIEAVNWAQENLNRCAVTVKFNARALDYGEQLTLSSAQVRLISKVSKANRTAKPHVAHPARWNQEILGGRRRTFLFDDITYYATSVEGQESTIITFDFQWPASSKEPNFIQIKGTRFKLPKVQLVSEQDYENRIVLSAQASRTAPNAEVSKSGTGRLVSDNDIRVEVSIRPLIVSKNLLPGGIKATTDYYLTEGFAEFTRGVSIPARKLRIKGIYEPDNTKIIQVYVKRGGPADIFGSVRQQAGDNATPVLVDSDQRTYSPIGYLYDRGEKVDIKLFPTKRNLGQLDELPQLSVAGGLTLRLIYRVTKGVQIVSFQLGNVTVATCDIQAGKPND